MDKRAALDRFLEDISQERSIDDARCRFPELAALWYDTAPSGQALTMKYKRPADDARKRRCGACPADRLVPRLVFRYRRSPVTTKSP
jgi:hypothetical protein